MKRILVLPLVIALSIFSSCQKQQSEAERQTEVDREVQRRLDAEHQAQEKEQLAQREADISAREKALAEEKENAAERSRERATASVRTEQRTQSEDRRPTASYDTFYTKLDPLGAWRETSTYGYVWQPREAQESRSWRPYTNGHWVYTDAGWTWVSDEPFGWAAYHYGRWTRLRGIGWVWVPGNEWAPAWVSWRKSNDYVGWAPLPPEARFDRSSGIRNWADDYYDIGPDQYCFVATNELGAPRIERAIIPPERNVMIVNQTTNVTNITYNNTTIVNQGPNYDELRSRTLQPIPRLRLERQNNLNFENSRAVVRGEIIEVPAPVIARAQPVERPRTIKETLTQAVVDRGWEAITDRQAAEKVRMKIKSEATPPPNAPPKTFVKPTEAGVETTPSSTAAASPAAAASATPSEAVPTPSTPSGIQRQNAAPLTQTPPVRQESPTRLRSPRPVESLSPATGATAAPETSPAASSPALSRTPAATISPAIPAESSTSPSARRSPIPLRTPPRVTTPIPSASKSVPEVSATASIAPSLTPPTSGSSGSSSVGATSQTRDEREAAKELRKQTEAREKHQKEEQHANGPAPAQETPPRPTTSPHSSGSSSSSPGATASPFLHDGLEGSKATKKEQKREREGVTQPSESASPSPSIPQ